MKRFRPLCTAALLWLGAGSATAAQAAQVKVAACIPAPAAEALFLTLAPDALRKVGEICTPSLPAGALLRRSPNAMIGRYTAEADAAWPAARSAIASLAGDGSEALLDSDMARPLLTTTLTQLIAKDIKPGDCPAINRILTLLEPLPPRNAAGLLVTILQLSKKSRNAPITICPAAPR